MAWADSSTTPRTAAELETAVRSYTDTELAAAIATLVDTSDSRLSDERTPTDGSVTEAKIASGQNVTWLGATFSGTVPGSLNAVKFSMSGASSTSASVGGVLNVTTTGHTGAGIVVYSNRGSDAGGRLVSIWADNAAFNQSAFYCRYDGVANAVVIDNQGSGTSNVALTVTSTNTSDTALGITASCISRAALKITHNGSSSTGSAAAITIQLDGTTPATQGIFIDTAAGATGKFANWRVNGVEMVTVDMSGNADFAGTITSGGDTVLTERSETFSISGDVATMTGAHRLYLKNGGTIAEVRASVGTAPTGASLIVDVNRNGTTIYGTQANRPTIAASGNTATGGAASNGTFSAGDYLTVDVDQVGSTVAGADLTVTVWWTE